LIRKVSFSQPQKITFDVKTNLSWRSNYIFYINWVETQFYSWNGSSDQVHEWWQWNANDWFKTFESTLLPAWNYEFKWVVTKRYWYQAYIWLDNIKFTCIWWWTGCWWTWFTPDNSLDKWDVNPWNVFTFSWSNNNMPWKQVNWIWEVSNWTHSIKNPTIPWWVGWKSELIYNKTLTQTQRISFDIKTEGLYYSRAEFYINWVKQYDNPYWSVDFNAWYKNYTSWYLPAWNYEFKWIINKWYSYSSYMWLDNINFLN